MKKDKKKDENFNPALKMIDIEVNTIMNDDTYGIVNKDEVDNLSSIPVCPVFYDEKGFLMNVSSPYDMAISNLGNMLLSLQDKEVYNRFINDAFYTPYGYYTDIKRNIGDVVMVAYNHHIINAVMNFCMSNIMKNFTVEIDGCDKEVTVIRDIIYKHIIEMNFKYNIRRCIDSYIEYVVESDVDSESLYTRLNYNIGNLEGHILTTISTTLTNIASEVCFNLNSVGRFGLYKEQLAREFKMSEMDTSTLYGLQMTDYTSMTYCMIPMIDALCWQMHVTLKNLIPKELKLFFNDISERDKLQKVR